VAVTVSRRPFPVSTTTSRTVSARVAARRVAMDPSMVLARCARLRSMCSRIARDWSSTAAISACGRREAGSDESSARSLKAHSSVATLVTVACRCAKESESCRSECTLEASSGACSSMR
jgi:hypothetical protein